MKHKEYAVDLFSGQGGVAGALRELGIPTNEFDIINDSSQDLTDSVVKRRLFRELRAKRIVAVMMGPPCTSFSLARNLSGALRSREQPWGINVTKERDKLLLKIGNECAITCVQVMQICLRKNIPFMFENPRKSKLWQLPPVAELMEHPKINFITTHQCQFGTRWNHIPASCAETSTCSTCRSSRSNATRAATSVREPSARIGNFWALDPATKV